MTKQWKSNGPEQVHLEKMFDEGSIEEWETAAAVQSRSPLFKPFSERVFTNHFRMTKSKVGYGATVTNPVSQIDAGSSVPELGLVAPNTQCRSTASDSNQETVHPMTHNRSPCWTWIYSENEKKKDFVCVAFPAVVGKNSKFLLSEDGLQVTIKYEWPEVMVKANELFSKSNDTNIRKLTMTHPKIHSFVSHLNNSGVTENSKLQGDITINLPKKVQRENDTWSVEKVVVSDTKMIILEFAAFQKSLIIGDANTSLDFLKINLISSLF